MNELGAHAVAVERDVTMRARDGVALASDVYRPDGDGPYPVLLRRTPYGKSLNDLAADPNEAQFFASHGYIVVVQDTRGRFASEGVFYPFIHEAEDGYDAVEWAATLPGSTGDVGMFGQSYGALCQYSTAPLRPPHLRTAVPVSGPTSYYLNSAYHQGVLNLAWTLTYLVSLAFETAERTGQPELVPMLQELLIDPAVRFGALKPEEYRRLPLTSWADRLGGAAPFLADILGHATDGPYWWSSDFRRHVYNVAIPMLHVGSWYDEFQEDSLLMYEDISAKATDPAARDGQALLMGPWAHLLPYFVPTSTGTGDIDFGPEALIDLHAIELAWFASHLGGTTDAVPCASPVRIFVTGENRWRDEQEWPLARAVPTSWYLRGDDSGAGGALSQDAPGDEPPGRYRYDPDDPVPTRGGHFLGAGCGVADQRPIEERDDVLVFTSEPLAADLEVTGHVGVELFAASSAPDTDFVVTIADVRPDGYSHNLVEGVVRARYRESLMYPTLIEPGRAYRYDIAMPALSHVLFAGHRLRVDVTSSCFPRWDRNPNTGRPFGTDADTVAADQTIFHDRDRPSRVVLPVVPRAI